MTLDEPLDPTHLASVEYIIQIRRHTASAKLRASRWTPQPCPPK